MTFDAPATRTVGVTSVTRAVADRLHRAGYGRRAAACTAEHLVAAELDGCTSHGLHLVPVYLTEIAEGKVDPAASVTVVDDRDTQMVLDAHSAPGHDALDIAVDITTERAFATGVAIMWIGNLPHVGRLAHYVTKALAQPGLVLLTVTSALDPLSALVAPPGRSRRVLGSNPLAVGVRGSDGAIAIYDASQAAIPFYRLLEHHQRRESLPTKGVVSVGGEPSDAPGDFFDGGAILPAGGHRGFGLSLALTLLTGLRTPIATGGRSTGFLLVTSTASALDLGAIMDQLRAAGAYIPGDRAARRESSSSSTLALRPELVAAMSECGVVLP